MDIRKLFGGKNFWRRLLLICFLFGFIAANAAGLFMGNIIYNEMCVRHSRLHANNTGRWQQILENGKTSRNWQDIRMPSRFGYSLTGTFIPNPQTTDKTLIFLHGFSESRLAGLSYLNIYLNAGYNLLLVDSRAHGESAVSRSPGVFMKSTTWTNGWIGCGIVSPKAQLACTVFRWARRQRCCTPA